jgi:hypothetical protein
MDIAIEKLRDLLFDLDSCPRSEDMDELNATLEDVILMLEDADDDDRDDIILDALDELSDLYTQYSKIPGMFPYSERLKDIALGLKNI